MAAYEEVVIGFDTRVEPAVAADAWDDARKEQFLLRFDAVPMSVDEAVWPRRWPPPDADTFEVVTPRFASLEDALANRGPGEVAIGITAWRGPGEPELPAGPAWPMKPDPDWVRLGWDVASGVFPSALTNCGYGDERYEWRGTWGPELNEHHLFDTLPNAFAFRDASHRRIPEHAPLSVLGVYRVA